MTKKEFVEKYLELCKQSGFYISNYGFEVEEVMLGVFGNSFPTFEQHKEELEEDLRIMHKEGV